ncbi:MAG: DUF2508 family protein [Veillonellales bacterium]
MKFVRSIEKIAGWLFGSNRPVTPIPSLSEMIDQARQDWLYAQQFYNDVTDNDLIEYAAYLIKTTERKYMYLVKQARRTGAIRKIYSNCLGK